MYLVAGIVMLAAVSGALYQFKEVFSKDEYDTKVKAFSS